jgi:hypothetical protein
MTALCPTPDELSRALAHGATTGLVEHMASCSRCSDEWSGALRLRALVRALRAPVPTRRRAADVRARLVAEGRAVRGRPLRKSGAGAVVVALAAAAAVAFAIGLRSTAPRSAPDAPIVRRHGVVTAAPGARYALLSAAPDEVVLLESGSIHVEVSPLGAGERFRVRAADGEVEVRGTAFDVDVENGHLDAVTVQHGRVEVRGASVAAATLAAGEGWHVASRAAPADTAPTPGDPEGAAAPSGDRRSDDAASRPRSGSMSGRSKTVTVQRTPPAPEQENVGAPVESPEVVSREAPSSPVQAAPVSPALNAAPKAPPAMTAAPESAPSAPPSRDRDDERRDRREERRERYDQRRMR